MLASSFHAYSRFDRLFVADPVPIRTRVAVTVLNHQNTRPQLSVEGRQGGMACDNERTRYVGLNGEIKVRARAR